MLNKPEILTVAEFRKLKGVFKKPVIIYFNKKQWTSLMSNLAPTKGKPPEKTLTLTLSELPDVPGGFGALKCPPECSKMTLDEGHGRCNCAPDLPSPGGSGGATVPRKFCFIVVRSDGTITCSGTCSDSKRSCSLGTWKVPGSVAVTHTCSCR